MNAGVAFTERYLKMMFQSLRDATPEQVQEELEHCRRENRKAVRIPRYFRKFFSSATYKTSTGYEMQYFKHEHPSRQLIFYNHGGAFIYPPVFFHWRFMHDLALRTHCDLIMPIYPKSPEYTCEFSVASLLDFYHNVIESQHYDKVHFIGDSAGACLSLVLAQEVAKRGWRKADSITLVSPCVDLSHQKEAEMRALQDKDIMLQLDRVIQLNRVWQGDLPATHPWVSPIFGDFSAIDNLSVYFGSDEIMKPEALFVKEMMEKAGKTGVYREYEGMFHTFPMFPIPEGFKALKAIVNDINLHS